MADRIFFVTGSPEDFTRGVALPEEMVKDLFGIANLAPATVDQLAMALEDAVGFLDDARLGELVRAWVPDAEIAESICGVVRNLRPSNVEQTLQRLRLWREADARRTERLPDATVTAIETNLPRLIRPFPAIERHRKAQRLVSLTGNQARQIDIVCDARPVFDADRRAIEGFVILTTLRLGYETQAGEAGCIELALSLAQLKELLEKAEKAQRKIDLLRESIRAWIPNGVAENPD